MSTPPTTDATAEETKAATRAERLRNLKRRKGRKKGRVSTPSKSFISSLNTGAPNISETRHHRVRSRSMNETKKPRMSSNPLEARNKKPLRKNNPAATTLTAPVDPASTSTSGSAQPTDATLLPLWGSKKEALPGTPPRLLPKDATMFSVPPGRMQSSSKQTNQTTTTNNTNTNNISTTPALRQNLTKKTQVGASKMTASHKELERNKAKLTQLEKEYRKIQMRNQRLERSLQIKKGEHKRILSCHIKARGDSVDLSKLGISPVNSQQNATHHTQLQQQASSRKLSMFSVMGEIHQDSKDGEDGKDSVCGEQKVSQMNPLNAVVHATPPTDSTYPGGNKRTGKKTTKPLKEKERSVCISVCLHPGVLMINLLLSIVIGIIIVSVILYNAGNASVNNQVRSTMRLTSRRVSKYVHNKLDSDHFGINLIGDSISRGVSTSSSSILLPSHDLYWVEARDMLSCSAIYFGDSTLGNMYGAGQFDFKTNVDPKNKNIIVPETRMLSKDVGRTNSLYRHYPLKMTLSESVHLQTIPDSKKQRKSSDPGILINAEYDPRTRDWYKMASILNTTLPVWSPIYRGASTNAWMFTLSRAIYRATDLNGPYTSSSSSITAPQLGVLGMDFDTRRLREILVNVQKEMFPTHTNDFVLSFFYHPMNTPPGTLSLVSSSDLDMFDVVNNVNGPTRLQMPSLLGSYYNAETNEPTALYPNVGRDVMKATIKSATRAMYLAKQIAENPNYNHYYEDLKKEEINSSSTAGTAASSSLPPWSTIDVNDPGNEWLVSAVQMDNVLNGIIITVASRRSYYYDFETQSIVGTVLATLAVVCFIAVILYLGENYVEKLGMTTTALSLGSMFVCFIFVIGLWIYTTANQMTRVVQILSDQLQTEVVEGLVAFLSIPSLINRWNYVLLQTGGLDLSMHNNSWNEPVVLSRVQLQTDSALSDEMRRRPSGGTRPYLIYGGSSDGGFAGCMASSSSQNGALGLGISSIDVSTRTTDPTKIAKQHWAYTASGNPPSFVNKRIQYDLSQISNMNSNVQLYRRGSYVKEKYQYFPNKRGWYINQEKNPDLPAWSDIYVFNSNQKLGITGTRGYALKGNVLGDSNGSNHLSTVLAVDYTLDIVSDLLKSILDEMKNDIEMEGGIYVIENDGYLVGVSSNTSVVVRYPDASSSDQLGAPQRLLAQDSIDPVVQITYNELKGRTSAVTGQNEGEASGIASFNENGTNAFVAEGSEIGRVLIRTKKLRNGLNWTVVVAVSEDSFLHRYRVKEIQGVVVGVGMCCITVYILSIFLGMSASLQKIITQIESTIGKNKNLVGTASLAGSTTVRKKQRKLSMVDQARKNLESVDNEDSSFFGGVVQDETEYDDGDEANAVQNLSDLSPDSEEFFNIYCNILRAPVESANLAMRVHNEDEPRPPSVFGKLQQILKLHNQPLLEIFEQFDDNDDGSVSFTEFCNGLKYFTERVQENFHPTQAELVLLFDALDKNGDGSVSFDELLQDNNVRVSESSATAAEKQRALRYITMVFNRGLSLPYILQLERSLDFARLKGYDLFESYWYQFIYAFFIFLSLSLAFLEAPASYGNGPRTTYLTQLNVKSMMHVVLPINGICLMVYVADMCFEVWLRGFRDGGGQQQQRGGTERVSKPTDNSTNGQNTLNVSRKPPHLKTKSMVSEEHKYGGGERSSVDMWVDGESEGGGGRDNNGSSALFREKRKCFDLFDYNNGGKLRTMAFARLILLSLMVFDFFYRVGKPYFTGPGTRDAEDNGDGIHRRLILYLPFSALIRPLWLLSRYRDVRRSLGNFIQTLVKATDVFILFVLLMTVGSIMGVLLLSGRMDDDNINNYNKFNNFLSGLLTLFVYMASAENYPDVAYPGTDCDRDNLANSLTGGVKGAGCPETAFHIYSILFSFAGAFLIVSLIIGVFEAEFAENTQKQEKKDRRNKRLGIIAAFILLDKDRGGTLDSNEFLSFINGTCETGRAFECPPGFTLTGQEFLELIDEMSHELNGNSTVALPNQVLVTPYRRCSVQRINIPKNWVVGKRILLQVEEESKDEVDSFTQNLSTQHLSYRNTDGTLKTAQDYHQEQAKLSAKLSVNISANVSANKNQHSETEQERKNNGERSQKQQKRMVTYHFSIPPNVRPGQTNVLVCGYSSEQKQLLHNTVNHKNITFGTIESSELAHWYCYNQGNGRFPYDIEEEKLKQQQTQQGKESDIITFYRYAAADMCVTNNLLENKTLIDSGTSNTNNTSSADSLYEPVERNQQKLSSSTSFKMGGKEIDPAEAMQRWKNSIRDAFAIYLNSKQHKSIMLVLTMCNIMCLALYGTGDDHGAFENILDILSICFMIIGFVEIGLRIFCFGWRDFWHVNDDFFQQCANRFDFYVNCLTLFVIVIAVVSKIGQSESLEFQRWNQLSGSSTVKSNDWTRLILAVPILRAFSTIYLIRDIVMGMLTVFPQYVHVFTLLGVVLYFYAVLGCFLFASDFKYNQSYEIPDANFNSMLDSLITLFQLFVGEAWNDVLQAALNTGKTTQALGYFISYSVIMTMLFTNLVIGIICSGYESISDIRKEHKEQQGKDAKISVKDITSALKEGFSTQKKRLHLEYDLRGVIHLSRASEFQDNNEKEDSDEQNNSSTAVPMSLSTLMVAKQLASTTNQRASGKFFQNRLKKNKNMRRVVEVEMTEL